MEEFKSRLASRPRPAAPSGDGAQRRWSL